MLLAFTAVKMIFLPTMNRVNNCDQDVFETSEGPECTTLPVNTVHALRPLLLGYPVVQNYVTKSTTRCLEAYSVLLLDNHGRLKVVTFH